MKSTLFLQLKTLLYNFQKFLNSHLEWKTEQLNGPGNYRELRETGPWTLFYVLPLNKKGLCELYNVGQFYDFIHLQPDFCEGISAGVHANPDDCYGYIMCDMAGIAHEMACPAGLKFNPTILVCDWPNNVECEDGSGALAEN